jgi:hypothetical protein
MAAVEREKERAAPWRKATLDLGPKAAAVEEETANKAVVNMVEVFMWMMIKIMNAMGMVVMYLVLMTQM